MLSTASSRLGAGSDTTSSWYVYAFVPAAQLARLGPIVGLGGFAIETVEVGDVAAVTSRISAELGDAVRASADLGRDDAVGSGLDLEFGEALRAHVDVIDHVFAHATVVPLRFGSLMPSPDALGELLSRQRNGIAKALSVLQDQREWEVAVTWNPKASEPPSEQRLGGTPTGREYLAARKRALDARRAAQDDRARLADGLHVRFAALASDAIRHPTSSGDPAAAGRQSLLCGRYLVSREEEGAFAASVDRILADVGTYDLRGTLSGPWPPYTFAPRLLGDVE